MTLAAELLASFRCQVRDLASKYICIYTMRWLHTSGRGEARGHGDGDQNTIIVNQILPDTDPVLYRGLDLNRRRRLHSLFLSLAAVAAAAAV